MDAKFGDSRSNGSEIFNGLISCRTNERIEAYHIRQKHLTGVSSKMATQTLSELQNDQLD